MQDQYGLDDSVPPAQIVGLAESMGIERAWDVSWKKIKSISGSGGRIPCSLCLSVSLSGIENDPPDRPRVFAMPLVEVRRYWVYDRGDLATIPIYAGQCPSCLTVYWSRDRYQHEERV